MCDLERKFKPGDLVECGALSLRVLGYGRSPYRCSSPKIGVLAVPADARDCVVRWFEGDDLKSALVTIKGQSTLKKVECYEVGWRYLHVNEGFEAFRYVGTLQGKHIFSTRDEQNPILRAFTHPNDIIGLPF